MAGCHRIEFIADEDMPEGHDFVTIEIPGGVIVLIRESALQPETFEGAWAAYRALGGRYRPPAPIRMVPHPLLRTA